MSVCPLHHDRPTPADLPSPVCGWHADRALDALRALTALPTAAADATVAHHLAAGRLSSPVSGSPAHELPIDELLVDLLRDARAIVASWCTLVAEERAVRTPPVPALTVTAPWLARHHPWSLRRTWAVDYTSELLDLAGRTRDRIEPDHARRVELSPCPQLVDGVRCTGILTARIRDTDELLPSVIRCQVCGVAVTADGWATLGHRIRALAA
jgi:hypothetical protein